MTRGRFRLSLDDETVLMANFRRGNSIKTSARILNLGVECLRTMEHYRNLYRITGYPRGQKQTPEHIAKRVKNWGKRKRFDGTREIGNIY